jgi:hypothetical protein
MMDEVDDRLLYVPVRTSRYGSIALKTGRLASGERIGLAFTSEAALASTLGPEQQWTRLANWLVPRMFAEIGTTEVRIDPLPLPLPAVSVELRKAATAIAVPAASTTAPAAGSGTPASAATAVGTTVTTLAPTRRRRPSRLRIAAARHAF